MGDLLSAAISIAFHGLAHAMVLYLISVGLSITMGLMGFVNLAHGAFAMAGGYAMTTLMNRYDVPFVFAVAAAVIVGVIIGLVLERLLYRRLYGGDELDQVLMTIGLIFVTVGAATYFWGPVAQPMRPPAALGGALGADLLAIKTDYALENLVYFLIVVAVGGLGSIRGPFVAAVLVGTADTAFKYTAPEFGAFFIYALTMVLLLWRPNGLFGRA